MHCAHRIPYDRVIDLIGCRIVEIGNVLQTFEWELEGAIGEQTAAVVWVAGQHLPAGALDLETTVRIAHSRGVPVVVDAAAQLPPISNFWKFTADCGADAAVFSGGKALRGPQASGLLVGSASLVAAARANGTPHQRLVRSMKVSKEEIAGLVAAVRRYVRLDHDALIQEWEKIVEGWLARLRGTDGVLAVRAFPNEAGQPTPRLRVQIDACVAGISASQVADVLWNGNPRIAVLQESDDVFYVTPDTLEPDEPDVVIDGLLRALRKARAIAA
jgi:L-seryl-tRNA(Ser) seleniumtransferase